MRKNKELERDDDWTASLLSPTLPTRMRWSDGCAKLIVLVEREAMERQWGQMAERRVGAVEFVTAIDTAAPAGRLLLNHVRLISESLEVEDVPDQPSHSHRKSK